LTDSGDNEKKVGAMETILAIVRYAFIVGIAIEGVLIARALWRLVSRRPAHQSTTDS
jgi:cytochrome b561